MDLDDSADRQRADLHESNATKISGCEYLCLSFVAKQDVRLILKGIPVHGPQSFAKTFLLEGFSVIEIVQMVVVHGRESSRDDRTALERSRSFCASQQFWRIERATFDRKFLSGLQLLPSKVARLGEGSNQMWLLGETS